MKDEINPLEKIKAQYLENPQEETFESYLNWHLENGFVYSTPEFFVMGRAIKIYPEEAVTLHGIDNFAIWDRKEQNCWYVHALAGDIVKAWGVLPYELPYMAFERVRDGKRELTLTNLERIRGLAQI